MISVTSMAEHDVFQKVDTDFVEQSLVNNVKDKTALTYICLNEEDWEEDAWKKGGWQYYRIVLPYKKVKNMDADSVRQWMLRLAEQRLGLVGQA